jgi:hypothetical protein
MHDARCTMHSASIRGEGRAGLLPLFSKKQAQFNTYIHGTLCLGCPGCPGCLAVPWLLAMRCPSRGLALPKLPGLAWPCLVSGILAGPRRKRQGSDSSGAVARQNRRLGWTASQVPARCQPCSYFLLYSPSLESTSGREFLRAHHSQNANLNHFRVVPPLLNQPHPRI